MKLIENYLSVIQENKFTAAYAHTRARGIATPSYTSCVDDCNASDKKFQINICALDCKIRFNEEIIRRLRGERNNCREASSPSYCVKKIEEKVRVLTNDIKEFKERLNRMKSQKLKLGTDIRD